VDAGEGMGLQKFVFVLFEGVGMYLFPAIHKMKNGVVGRGFQMRNSKRVR
jgi:hypothetical protein